MFDYIPSTPLRSASNSLEVAMHARSQNQKLALLVASYRKASGVQSKQSGRSIRQLFAALITGLR